MVADGQSFSPSAGKPALAVESWQFLGLPLQFRAPQPLSAEQFGVAHDPEFVADVLSCRRNNGFGNKSPAVAAALPLDQRRHALGGARGPEERDRRDCPLLRLPSCRLRLRRRLLHLQRADGHGRASCWPKARRTRSASSTSTSTGATARRTSSIACTSTTRSCITARAANTAGRREAEAFLAAIAKILERFAGCDLVLYQAGADPHIDDPLGGWLTTEQLYRRDRAVFEGLQRLGIPVAWNLAGGYQRDEDGGIRPVLDIHDNTLVAFVEAHGHAVIPASPFAEREAA